MRKNTRNFEGIFTMQKYAVKWNEDKKRWYAMITKNLRKENNVKRDCMRKERENEGEKGSRKKTGKMFVVEFFVSGELQRNFSSTIKARIHWDC